VRSPNENDHYDVIVVGGGVSGVYAAWRLARFAGKRCLLLESSDRIGGRLHSIVHPETPHIQAEAGGMRFKESHRSVFRLAQHLGLDITAFPGGGPENLCYSRGQHFTRGDLRNTDVIPYRLTDRERGYTPDEILVDIIHRCFPVSGGDPERELRDMSYRKVPLWQAGWWNILSQELSTEAVHFVHHLSGLGGYLRNWNAYSVALQHYTSELDGPCFRLGDGFQSMPLELHARYQSAGGETRMNSSVKGIYRDRDGALRVGLHSGESHMAAAVVLALPRRALELLDPLGLPHENPTFGKALGSVRLDCAAKIFLWYENEWWSEMGLSSGASVTDLPLRQCFYFGTESTDNGHSGGLLMASYNDGIASDYWDTYAHRPRFENRDDFSPEASLPEDLLDDLQRQLEILHDRKLPRPHSAILQSWNGDPYGGGWHHWNTNWKPWEVQRLMRRPVEDARVHVCGEAFSSAQGWVKGALDSAEDMLGDQFGLEPPDWLVSQLR
jgi:monoamine oxidase